VKLHAQIGFPKTKEHIVSPSQLKLYGTPEVKTEGCPRAWGYEYIEGLRKPPLKAAQLGTDVHKRLEDYLSGGKANWYDRIGRLAELALEHYRVPVITRAKYGKVDDVELKIALRVNDVWYRGVVDLPWVENDGIPNIADHKTSSNPEKHGLTPKEFLTDPQALMYALWALEWTGKPIVRLQWTYIATQGKKRSFAVRKDLERDEVFEAFERLIHPKGREIVKAKRTIKKAEDLPMNTRACGNYGGCPHARYCPRTKLDVISAVFGNKKEKSMRLLKTLRNKKGQKAPPRPEEVAEVVDMPGRRVNSPEAPKNDEVAQAISREVGAVSQKTHDDAAKQVADAAQGATTPEEVQAQVRAALDAGTDFDPKASLTRDQILKLTRIGKHRFAASRDLATVDTPFAHGRTLNKMVEDGLIEYEREGKFSMVTLAVESHATEMKEAGISDRPLLEKIRGFRGEYTDDDRHAYVSFLAATKDASAADALFVEFKRTFA